MSTNLKFITGFSGEAHIKPSMDAQWHSASSGKETFVYDYGEKFDLTVNQATSTISIKDGIGQIQGRLFIIEESLIETISYPNVPPEVGLTRIDTILLHWGTDTKIVNGETITVNTCDFEYHKNPLANGQAESFEETDLNLGDTDAYYPMWHVTWTQNGIQEVEAIFEIGYLDSGLIGLDTTAPTGTTDGDLYDAITTLGWASVVIELSKLNVKKILTKLLNLFIPTQWNALTLASGYTSRGDNKYRKIGNIVEVRVSFSASAAHTNFAQCFTTVLPQEYRPSSNVKIPVQGNTTAICVVEITSSGVIQTYISAQTSAYLYGRVSYTVD